MAFEIDDEETIQMIQKVCEMTGKDHEAVVRLCVQEALVRARAEKPAEVGQQPEKKV